MAFVGGVLALLGLIFLVSAFLPSRFFREKPTLKGRAGATLAGVVMLFLGIALLPSNPPPQHSQANAAAEQSAPKEKQRAPAGEEKDGKPKEAPSAEAGTADKGANAEEEIAAPPTIPGLKWVDITLNLEKEPYNFKFSIRQNRLTPTVEREAREVDPSTGAEISIRVQSYGDDVVLYEVSVSGNNARRTASWLIPYMATAPFDGNPQAESKAWAIRAIEKVGYQKPVYRQVGDVLMELSGNPPHFYVLQVNHKDLEEYLSRVLR